MPPKKTPAFEERLHRLQEIVTVLEGGETPLEQSVLLYREGLELSRSCRSQLEQARAEVRVLTEQGLEPLDTATLGDEDNDETPQTLKETSR